MTEPLQKILLRTPGAWRAAPWVGHALDATAAFCRRQVVESPFASGAGAARIVHVGYHRGGTTWFSNVLHAVAMHFGLPFQNCAQEHLRRSTRVYLCNDGIIDLEPLDGLVGSHMIRDPRDLVVSGYFFHLWTDEPWAHRPRPEYGGRSYQQYLKSLDRDSGLAVEIERTGPSIRRMLAWNYADPRFLELRYEQVMADEQAAFHRIFRHYGFTESAVAAAVAIAGRHNFTSVSGRKVGQKSERSHLRSGQAGQWHEVLTAAHKARFKELYGDAVVTLGYERHNDW